MEQGGREETPNAVNRSPASRALAFGGGDYARAAARTSSGVKGIRRSLSPVAA